MTVENPYHWYFELEGDICTLLFAIPICSNEEKAIIENRIMKINVLIECLSYLIIAVAYFYSAAQLSKCSFSRQEIFFGKECIN